MVNEHIPGCIVTYLIDCSYECRDIDMNGIFSLCYTCESGSNVQMMRSLFGAAAEEAGSSWTNSVALHRMIDTHLWARERKNDLVGLINDIGQFSSVEGC